jgi:hypothetical protein
MPLSYFSHIEHIISDDQYQSVYSMQYKWGIDDFNEKYGNMNLREGEMDCTPGTGHLC